MAQALPLSPFCVVRASVHQGGETVAAGLPGVKGTWLNTDPRKGGPLLPHFPVCQMRLGRGAWGRPPGAWVVGRPPPRLQQRWREVMLSPAAWDALLLPRDLAYTRGLGGSWCASGSVTLWPRLPRGDLPRGRQARAVRRGRPGKARGQLGAGTGTLPALHHGIRHGDLGRGLGHYISVDTSYEGEKAVLSSPELYSEEWSCVRLIYQIATTSETSPDPARLNLYLRQEGESFDRLLWSATEPSDSWLIASLDLTNSTKKYKIVLEGEMGQDKSASIAVFEIKITPGYCIECDFEENHLCGFVNRWNPNVNWFVGGGNIRNSQSILPKDHTLNSELGHYMYVDSVYVKHFQEVAQLISPKTTAPMSGCLSFYYQLKQESSIVFTVYLRDTSGFYEEIWKTDSALSVDWALAEVDFNVPYPMEVKQSFLYSPATTSRLPQTSVPPLQAKSGTWQWPSSDKDAGDLLFPLSTA
ncbi:PREDICTED: MAM domain-containing protein 2-like [Fulmarus glacialis]|uniref:MAM domain-containing protein 2-like n=1 Tax=Fulmarus glacialis TaxID=30455 RepID=UPI00051BBCB6|nr:PREDICTED: MAM domain-containing protein 2-like [Fulmarus glacialis]